MTDILRPDEPGNDGTHPNPKKTRLTRGKSEPKAKGIFLIGSTPNGCSLVLTGRMAEAMAAMVNLGAVGLTEYYSGGYFPRLSATVSRLCREKGIPVSRYWRPHPNGQHTAYVLDVPVVVTSFEPASFGTK